MIVNETSCEHLADTAAIIHISLVEQDTAENEDVNFEELLYPNGVYPRDKGMFSVSVNHRVLQGWVKQPSPCCAAAAVAGAINALGQMTRNHAQSIQHTDVLAIYVALMKEQIDRCKISFERKLGGGSSGCSTALDQLLNNICTDIFLCERGH